MPILTCWLYLNGWRFVETAMVWLLFFDQGSGYGNIRGVNYGGRNVQYCIRARIAAYSLCVMGSYLLPAFPPKHSMTMSGSVVTK